MEAHEMLRAARKRRGLQIREAAEAAGVQPTVWGEWEGGKRHFRRAGVAAALDVIEADTATRRAVWHASGVPLRDLAGAEVTALEHLMAAAVDSGCVPVLTVEQVQGGAVVRVALATDDGRLEWSRVTERQAEVLTRVMDAALAAGVRMAVP